jgi:hypothetical protein
MLYAISLFAICMVAMHLARPAAIYAPDGSFRPFGVGYTDKTVLPGWLAAGILAVFAYIVVVSGNNFFHGRLS